MPSLVWIKRESEKFYWQLEARQHRLAMNAGTELTEEMFFVKLCRR